MITFQRGDHQFTYRVAGIAIRNGALLLQTTDTDDVWVLPSGRCEMHEDAAAALTREMIQEIDAAPNRVSLAWVVENFFHHDGRRCHELGLYFTMTFPDDSPIHRQGETFTGTEGDLTLHYRWVPSPSSQRSPSNPPSSPPASPPSPPRCSTSTTHDEPACLPRHNPKSRRMAMRRLIAWRQLNVFS